MAIKSFNKGAVVRETSRNEIRSKSSKVVNTPSTGDVVRQFEAYAEIKHSDLPASDIFVQQDFNRIRTSTHINGERYIAIARSGWAVYSLEPSKRIIEETELDPTESFWFTEDAGGYCYMVGQDGDLSIKIFDGNSVTPLDTSSVIPYTTNMDVAVLPSGELLILSGVGSYYIVSQDGTVSTGKFLDDSLDQIFVEKLGNAVSWIGVNNGNLYAGVTIDGQAYTSIDVWSDGDRKSNTGTAIANYLIDTILFANILDTSIYANGYSVIYTHESGKKLCYISSGGYTVYDLDLDSIATELSATLYFKNLNNLSVIAHGFHDGDLFLAVLDNANTERRVYVYKGLEEPYKVLESNYSTSDDLYICSPSAPDRESGVKEVFFINEDSLSKNLSIFLKPCSASSSLLITEIEADELLTEPLAVMVPKDLTSPTEMQYQEWALFKEGIYEDRYSGPIAGDWMQCSSGLLSLFLRDQSFAKQGYMVSWNAYIQITDASAIGGGNSSVFGFDVTREGASNFRLLSEVGLLEGPIGFCEVSKTVGGTDDGIYYASLGGYLNPGAGKGISGLLFYDIGNGIYLDADNFQAGTEIKVWLNYSALYNESAAGAVSDFDIDNTTPSTSDTVTMESTSLNNPTSFAWSITGGAYTLQNGTTLADEIVEVRFDDASTIYTVSLTVSNKFGSAGISPFSQFVTTS